MKTIILVTFTLLSLQSVAQVQKTNLASFELKGPVKSTLTLSFLAEEKFGELVKDGKVFMTEAAEFNKDGFLIALKETEKEEDEEDQVFYSRLTYDANNKLIEVNRFEGKDELVAKFKIKYNEQGLESVTNLYDGEGVLEERTVFTYNSRNLLIKDVSYDKTGKVTDELTNEYNGEGQVSKDTYVFENSRKNKETKITEYTYNSKGQVIKKDELRSDGTRKIFKLEYDQFGNIIKEFADKDNYTTHTYRYDSRNNWIYETKVNCFSGIKVEYITERSIKYH